MEQELLPHRPAGPEERWSHTLARAHSLSPPHSLFLSLLLSLSLWLLSTESRTSPASAPKLGRCHQACERPLRVGRIRGPARSSPCTCQQGGTGDGPCRPEPEVKDCSPWTLPSDLPGCCSEPRSPRGEGRRGRAGGAGGGGILLAGGA